MRNKLKKCLIIVLLNFATEFSFCLDNYFSWDFTDGEIKDILFALSLESNISIVADDTVNGQGTFQFSGSDFNEAFNAFLKENRLYVKKEQNIWTVSKFRFEQKGEQFFVDAYDLYPYEIIEKLSENIDFVITYDSLPNSKNSIHIGNVNKETLLKSLCNQFGEYELVVTEGGFHIGNKERGFVEEDFLSSGNINIEFDEEGKINFDLKNCDFFQVIEIVFEKYQEYSTKEKIQFCFLTDMNREIGRAVFSSNNITEGINILCAQNGYKLIKDENIYYIIVDNIAKENLVIQEKKWELFSLNYASLDEVLSIIYKRFKELETIGLLSSNSFLCKCNEEEKKLIEELIVILDEKKSVYLINLKYLKPEEFLESLPPNINKERLFIADSNSSLYFEGTEAEYNFIVDQINIIDKPVKRICYDLLILQYDETEQNTWASNFGIKSLKYGDKRNISAQLGSVMNFNLNIVNAFGISFAAELQASMENNNTKVFADTTLHGVSGKKINFQNTNTYRYRDNNVNPETGEPVYSGVTREIITGIQIDILGWISGDGVITSSVTASISRQGIDNSRATGNPPPTTEKVVTTEVTGKSGEPIILSGLLLSATSESEKGTPFVSQIPLVGNLFKDKVKTTERSQMVIYLVPHVLPQNFESEEESNTRDEAEIKRKDESYNKEEGETGEQWFYKELEYLENLIKKDQEVTNE